MRCLPTVADFMEVVTNAAGESEIVERTPDVSVFGAALDEPIVVSADVTSNGRSRSDLARIRSILEEGNDPEAIIQSEASNHAEEITDPEVSNISEAIDAQIEDQAEDNSTTVDPGSEVENSAVESSEAENSEAESSETEEPIEPIAAETENPSPDLPSAEQPVTDQAAIERLSAIASQPLDTDDDRFNLDNFDLDTPADRLDTGILKLNSGFAAPVESEEIGEIDEPKPSNTPLTDLEVARRLAYLQRQPPLLEVEHLKVGFPQRGLFGRARRYTMAVNDVSFQVFPGETLGLVGESGCGKSTLARTLMRLIDPLAGKIRFEDRDILALKPQALRFLRRDMQTIFQDPGNALNPRMSVGAAILEPMQIHNFGASKKERLDRVKYLLDRVDLDISAINRYPHEFSGGQRQRICIARALALEPKFVICDESVSALDVSVQAQVLNLLKELQEEFGLTYIFISHDLSVVKFMSDRIMVMNQGQIEEIGPADRVYRHPERDYTRKLIASIPRGHISDRAAS
jgi:ABC-type glutathione transport system ATPase component